jgi:hypothetical protein
VAGGEPMAKLPPRTLLEPFKNTLQVLAGQKLARCEGGTGACSTLRSHRLQKAVERIGRIQGGLALPRCGPGGVPPMFNKST